MKELGLGFKGKGLNAVAMEAKDYMYSLLFDYEQFILKYGLIPVTEFIDTWTCLSENQLKNLDVGDIVYDCTGNEYRLIDHPYYADDEISIYMEAVNTANPNGQTDILQSGEIYGRPIVNTKILYSKIKPKGETKLCPILITNQRQPQS